MNRKQYYIIKLTKEKDVQYIRYNAAVGYLTTKAADMALKYEIKDSALAKIFHSKLVKDKRNDGYNLEIVLITEEIMTVLSPGA